LDQKKQQQKTNHGYCRRGIDATRT
jgi:hypothetical protein